MAFQRIGLGLALLALLAVSACGSSSNSTSQPTPEALRSGRVDIGGYELDWMCRGESSPTIVAEAGYDSAGTSTYFDLMEPMSRISRVCTYDRAGTGTSDRRPDGMHVTSLLQAHELHGLLEGAAISPPYVVVAHSYGGFVVAVCGYRRNSRSVLIDFTRGRDRAVSPLLRAPGWLGGWWRPSISTRPVRAATAATTAIRLSRSSKRADTRT